MSPVLTLLLAGLVVFLTHALEAITGFGCTVLALPFITALFGLKSGVMTLTVLAWILALYIAISKRRDIDWKALAVILGFVVAGLPIGMYLFRSVDPGPLKKVLAAFIIVASGLQLLAFAAPRLAGKRLPKPLGFLLLFLGGIVHGMFSSGGPLVVLYASQALPDKGRFRATLCVLWATLNSIIIVSYLVSGSVTAETATRTGLMLPFLAVGIAAGEWAHHRVKPAAFKLIVFSMLLVTGFIMLLS
jgi:uncharacterized membrane protein YfcA